MLTRLTRLAMLTATLFAKLTTTLVVPGQAMEREADPMRFMLPSLYTTDWFQAYASQHRHGTCTARAVRVRVHVRVHVCVHG